MMKTTKMLFLLILISTTATGQGRKYWAETTPVDQFIVIENEIERIIPPQRDSRDLYIFKTTSADAQIVMKCIKCEDKVSLILFGKYEDAYTEQIYLEYAEGQSTSIGIQAIFERTKKRNLKTSFESYVDALKDFFKSARIGRIGARGAVLKSGEKPDPTRPNLDFEQADYLHYFDQEELSIKFAVFKDLKVSCIYILSHDGELVFLSGDGSLVREVFDISSREIPENAQVLQSHKENGGKVIYEFNWQNISEYLDPVIDSDKWYQLGIEVKEDVTKFNPYLINFMINANLKDLMRRF